MTFAEKYNAEVNRVFPQFAAKLLVGPEVKTGIDIYDGSFSRGDFLDGMAYAIVRMVEANDALEGKSE